MKPLHIKGKNGKLYSPIHYAAPGEDRWKMRSVTPSGFATAFYEANRLDRRKF